ncbi:MAG: hypothetical protein ACYDBH_17105, partial [Acidobacteriaceae bacterium]
MKNNEHGKLISLRSATRFFLKHFALTLLATMVLSGCGGGGGGGSGSSASGANVLSGTAAAGAPLANSTVILKDSAGVTTATTADAHGNYSFDVSTAQFPVMLEVQPNTPGAAPLFSAALAAGTVNVTPLTTLQVFEAVGGTDPSEVYKFSDFSKITNSALYYGKTAVVANLVPQFTFNGLDLASADPITTPMVADGTGIDAVMDQTNVLIVGNYAYLADSTGARLPFGSPNEMTLAVDGMSGSNYWAFLGFTGPDLSGDLGFNDGYVRDDLKKVGVPGIDQPLPFAPNYKNPSTFFSNVPWSRDPLPPDTDQAVDQLISQLEMAAHKNNLAEENGGIPGPINIVAHSWGGIIAYIALRTLEEENSPIQIANLITLGTPVECLAGDPAAGGCPNYDLPVPTQTETLGEKVLENAPQTLPPGYNVPVAGPIVKPTNVTTWTNYWGRDDVLSAKISPQPGVTNKYVDCEGNLYGDISADPVSYPCAITNADLTNWKNAVNNINYPFHLVVDFQDWNTVISIGTQEGTNHVNQYFQSPVANASPTLVDIDWLISSSRTDTYRGQNTGSSTATSPPTAFSVSVGQPSCNTTSSAGPAVNLTWTAAGGADYYHIYRNGVAVGVNLNASQLGLSNNLGLVAGQTYVYKIQAINDYGTTWSNEIQVAIPATVCGSNNPTSGSSGGTATPLSFAELSPASLSTSAASYQPTLTASGANFNNLTQIRFNWNGPTVGSLTWYKGDQNWNAKMVVSSDGSSMTLAPVVTLAGDPPGLTTWTVTLMDASGATASKTFTVNYTPPATPPGYFSLITNDYCSTTSPVGPVVTLSWTASSGADSYSVYRGGTVIASNISGTSFVDSGSVSAGQTYTYDIVASNSAGTTESTAVTVAIPSTICTVSIPTTPLGLSPGSTSGPGQSQASSTVTVSWGASGGAQLYMGGITDIATGSDVVTIDTSGTSMTATLSPGKQYRWYVYACNSSGCSSSSALYYFQTPGSTSTLPLMTATISANPTTVPA